MSLTIGRYEVLRVLGQGGMAVVHLARQPDLQRLIALKELRALRGEDPSYAQRFLREGDEMRIDAIFIVPGRLPRHLADIWQG